MPRAQLEKFLIDSALVISDMKIIHTQITGCYEIQTNIFTDERGVFVKTFHAEEFGSLGLCVDWKEQYYSTSNVNVLRGLHFQLPPYDHAKLVYCVAGVVEDVALDLRVGSPTYGKVVILELSAQKANMIYLPKGLAHGFYTRNGPAIMVYNVSSSYVPDADRGIRWDSAGINWSVHSPLLSDRDRKFPAFADFKSPFLFCENVL